MLNMKCRAKKTEEVVEEDDLTVKEARFKANTKESRASGEGKITAISSAHKPTTRSYIHPQGDQYRHANRVQAVGGAPIQSSPSRSGRMRRGTPY
jgi:hypothetical protein